MGDSAGGTLALVVARRARATALILTNPNVDLTLSGFDAEATGGPDRDLSKWAFGRWTGGRLQDAPDLAGEVRGLPSVFVAVGSADALLQDSRRLVQRCHDAGVRAELHVISGASHGFMGGPDLATVAAIIREAGKFVGFLASPGS